MRLSTGSEVGKDKTTTMFSSLVSAMLNVWVESRRLCEQTIIDANNWMATNGPVGSGVGGVKRCVAAGEPLHKWLDAYNGQLCDQHRK
jgi:hypothetical protein